MDYSITATKLCKKFGSFTAVNEISFSVKRGEIFGFLGANGAGKTTAMRMLCGLLKPTSGEATVAGLDVFKESEKIKKRIGYMSQKFSLYEDLTLFENIRFYGTIYGLSKAQLNDKAHELLTSLGLADRASNMVGELPLGWRQKLAFSVAMVHNPDIVFLDEPTSGVDPIVRRQFWDMIYEVTQRGVTVFITTHYMDEAEYCDRVSIMVDGEIKALDTPTKLKEHFGAATMNDVFLQLARGKN